MWYWWDAPTYWKLLLNLAFALLTPDAFVLFTSYRKFCEESEEKPDPSGNE
jgi:hypothetical protein